MGFGLRIFRLDAVPLRGDEAFSVLYWARLPLDQSLTQIATIEPHPALTYIVFHLWGSLVGTSEFAMRALPVLTNVLGIAAIHTLARRTINSRFAVLAALLFCLNPFEIWHAQDARNYAIWAGLSLIALAAGLRALQSTRRRDWLLYALMCALAANIFYFELLTLAAFGLYVGVTHRPQLRRWLLAASLPVVTAGLSFIILQRGLLTAGSYGGNTARFDLIQLLGTFPATFAFGTTLPLTWTMLASILVIIILVGGIWTLHRLNGRSGLLVSFLLFVPVLLLSLISTRLNLFDPRYILAAAPALMIAATAFLFSAFQFVSRPQHLIRIGFGAVWLALNLVSLNNLYFNSAFTKSQNWPELTRYIDTNLSPDDLVIQLSVDPAFGYYYSGEALDIALPASPSQPQSEIESVLAEQSEQHKSIWLVGSTLSGWPNAGIVETWLGSRFQTVLQGAINGLPFRQYRRWEVRTDESSGEPLAVFGDSVALMGFHVIPAPQPSGEVTVWLYWRPVRPTDTPLKVFVHVLGEINPATGTPLWSQDDQYPQDGRLDSTNWPIGSVFRDVYGLSMDGVRPGQYQIAVGWYDPVVGERLIVGGGDSYALTAITVP
ncbi:MAG: glycosyltransferase family 39 protein [Anaerolineae bacterium]|nr:glycosyltransferase family 39 protein [Anaerolineae bacterium]